MNDSMAVGFSQGPTNLVADLKGAPRRQNLALAEDRRQGLAVDEFHGHIKLIFEAIEFTVIVDGDGVGVGEFGVGRGLDEKTFLEAFVELVFVASWSEDFERKPSGQGALVWPSRCIPCRLFQ